MERLDNIESANRSEPTGGQQIQINWRTTLTKPHGFVWYTAVTISTGGVFSIGLGSGPFVLLGIALLAIGGSILALLSLATELRSVFATDTESKIRLFVILLSAIVFIISVILSSSIITPELLLNERIVILTLGLQALFLTVDAQPSDTSRRARVALLFASHGALVMASGTILTAEPQKLRGAFLLYVAGFSFLSIHAFWSRQRRPGVSPPRPMSRRRYWESLLLIAVITGGISAVVVALTIPIPSTIVLPDSVTGHLGMVLIGEAGVVALAILGVPDSPPPILATLTTPRLTVFQHVIAVIVLTNSLFLGLFFVVPQAYTWILATILILLFIGITLNYLSIGYNLWNKLVSDSSVSGQSEIPLTVIVSAFNEADILSETLSHNLAALPQADFLFVPAANSTDGTSGIMKRLQSEFPDQIRVVDGTTGSKAGDLNQVWEHINTEYVLLLDADETIVPDSVATAYQELKQQPEIGIVQGRKLAAYPDSSVLSEFITVERQFSTWIHHTFMAKVLNSGHFAGSAAIMRKDVAMDVGGFNPDALTEDIELTVRVYLETDWELSYNPEMLVRELNPSSWLSLIRQRERWARGWAQVAITYFGEILRPDQRLNWRRSAGLSWELFTAVSSPIYTLFPALIIYWLFAPVTPTLVIGSALFTLYLIIERGVSFFVASFFDPKLPPRNVRSLILAPLYGYAWMVFGWIIQLHSIYLQLAGATSSWDVTRKQSKIESTGSRSRQLLSLDE